MTTHAHFQGEFGPRIQQAAQRIQQTATRLQKSVEMRESAKARARQLSAVATKKTGTAQAASATKRAMVARAVVFTHDQDIARHKTAHEKAVTHHAALVALEADARRGAGFKPREAKARMIGVASPDWHFSDVMGSHIRESHEEVATPKTAVSKTPLLDKLSAERPRGPYVVPPAARRQVDPNWMAKEQASKQRSRERADKIIESQRGAPPGVSTVALPKMSTVKKQRLLDKISQWIGR